MNTTISGKMQYLDDLKVTINDSINSEEAQALISQFGSEEEYWQHESEVYKINLPIEKYLESLKQEYSAYFFSSYPSS